MAPLPPSPDGSATGPEYNLTFVTQDNLFIITREMAAILDVKWSRAALGGSPVTGVVNAAGEVQLHRLSLQGSAGEDEVRCTGSSVTTGPKPHCTEIQRLRIADDDRLALSLDWSNALQHR